MRHAELRLCVLARELGSCSRSIPAVATDKDAFPCQVSVQGTTIVYLLFLPLSVSVRIIVNGLHHSYLILAIQERASCYASITWEGRDDSAF